MKIGILQTGHSPENMMDSHGDYGEFFPRLLAGYGFEFQTFSVVDGQFPSQADEADGWLITGSKHGAYEDHDWIPPLEEFLRAAYARSIPIIGVCFGHQILAQALGGKVEKFNGGWSVGPVEYDVEGSDQKLSLLAWHQDQVTEKPADAEVLASTDFCEFAMLSYGNKALSIQPHPEFDDAFVQGLIDTRGKGVVPQNQLDEAEAKLGTPLSTKKIADQFAAFFRQSQTAA